MSLLLSETFVAPLNPEAEIAALWAALGDAGRALGPPACLQVDATDLPRRFASLLLHRRQMTTVLGQQYAAPMRLAVLASGLRGNLYTRLVQLRPSRFSTVVEHSLVIVDLTLLPPATGRELLKDELPIGELLIRHAVHTHVAPRWFVKVEPPLRLRMRIASATDVPRWGVGDRGQTLYGRVGRIFCDGAPAVRMIEIVTGTDRHDLIPMDEPTEPISQTA
jgi:hypothetical protein